MKKLLFAACLSLLSLATMAQSLEPCYGTGTFVIRGQVERPDGMKSWKMAITGYIENSVHEIPVAADGSFEQALPIADVQDLYLYLDNTVSLFSHSGDTITLRFDGRDPVKTLEITGTSAERTAELRLFQRVSLHPQRADLPGLFMGDLSKEEKLRQATDYYAEQMAAIDAFAAERPASPFLNKMRDDVYYGMAACAALEEGMVPWLPSVHDRYRMEGPWFGKTDFLVKPYQVLDETLLRTSPNYRDYLQNQVMMLTEFFPMRVSQEAATSNTLLLKYQLAVEYFASLPLMRDWYLSVLLNDAIQYEPMEKVMPLYLQYMETAGQPEWKAFLSDTYQNVGKLTPGSPAPDFELIDDQGKTVRLSDFRGKVVYLDFWGTSCPPCVYEFRNWTKPLHDRYKDEVVFLYICVDSPKERWLKGVETYALEGVNLIAEGWENNPACRAYNVKAIPQYVLIDPQGKIVNNQAPRPSELMQMKEGAENELDKLLNR
jgi:peroxiredoxin